VQLFWGDNPYNKHAIVNLEQLCHDGCNVKESSPVKLKLSRKPTIISPTLIMCEYYIIHISLCKEKADGSVQLVQNNLESRQVLSADY